VTNRNSDIAITPSEATDPVRSESLGAGPLRVDDEQTLRPLCVDLDGTLIETDMLVESVLACARQRSLYAFSLLMLRSLVVLATSGKAAFKAQWAVAVENELFNQVPVSRAVLGFLQDEQRKGRPYYLVTACEQKLAEVVARSISNAHNLSFAGVYGSSDVLNLRGIAKSRFLVEKFGRRGFDYIGDSKVDIPVWESAAKAIVVARQERLWSKVQAALPNSERISTSKIRKEHVLKQLRVHQWVKNILVFTPPLMAHSLLELSSLFSATVAFIAFSASASAVYIINDLIDLESDRLHATKRFRPLASGLIPITAILSAVPALLLFANLIALLLLPSAFLFLLAGYFALTSAYSVYLKRVPILDIIVLASLYVLRVLAGGVATNTPVSPWLLTFSLFIFLSLACAKRYAELLRLKSKAEEAEVEELAPGRGYVSSDRYMIGQSGIAAGFGAVLVMALYFNSTAVRSLYSKPQVLWLLGPLVLYWVLRIWLLAYRGEMHEDPIVFALRDKASFLVAGLSLAVLVAAM
jgi:4-hydroxybenzoate polyprenyltransferase